MINKMKINQKIVCNRNSFIYSYVIIPKGLGVSKGQPVLKKLRNAPSNIEQYIQYIK